jgi:hypothetical protein
MIHDLFFRFGQRRAEDFPRRGLAQRRLTQFTAS